MRDGQDGARRPGRGGRGAGGPRRRRRGGPAALARSAALALALLPLGAAGAGAAEATPAARLRAAIDALCPLAGLDGFAAEAALPGAWLMEERRLPPAGQGPARAIRVTLILPGGDELLAERRQTPDGRLRQFVAALHLAAGDGPARPRLQAFADGGCAIRSARRIRHEGPGRVFLDQLDGDLATLRWSETLEAPWPEGRDPGGPRVALVDSGLAYDLPLFADRLARDAEGRPLGYDFWDLDPWPYDGDTSRGPFLPIRHGSAVASVLVREAPTAALVPFRYPRGAPDRMADLLDRAEAAGARILAMPLGANRRADWQPFADAMTGRDLLAIVSAGNDGRDIDREPVWPASFDLDAMIVVTSADAFGRLAEGSNWGASSVDVMVPGENVAVTDFRGAAGTASGTSYAVPRLAALAARILAAEPGLDAAALKARILARAAPSPFARPGLVAHGWIPDPERGP